MGIADGANREGKREKTEKEIEPRPEKRGGTFFRFCRQLFSNLAGPSICAGEREKIVVQHNKLISGHPPKKSLVLALFLGPNSRYDYDSIFFLFFSSSWVQAGEIDSEDGGGRGDGSRGTAVSSLSSLPFFPTHDFLSSLSCVSLFPLQGRRGRRGHRGGRSSSQAARSTKKNKREEGGRE